MVTVEPAKEVFRQIDPSENYPIPESCTPYVDANSLGYYLKNVLPLVFVKTRKGELLLEARVALKYLRENARQFSKELKEIEKCAATIFRETEYENFINDYRYLFSDVVQPYSSFTNKHISIRAGLWINTPSAISTVIGPPINQKGLLSVVTGVIETDWHHFELFVVIETPRFDEQVLIIPPGTIIAQVYFVTNPHRHRAEIRFSKSHPSAEPSYAKAWDEDGNKVGK